jgi:malate dehydrogenase (oxaloacetate-decarboxylating)
MDPKYKHHSHPMFGELPLSTSGPMDCTLSGVALLGNSYFNKGTAFTHEERAAFDLYGLLPPNIQTLEEQLQRAYGQYSTRPDPLAKNTFMASMREQNAVLFYRVIKA